MQASTHTLELDPAISWRLVGTRNNPASASQTMAIASPAASADAPVAAAPHTEQRRQRSERSEALELGCFVATLGLIWLLQIGVVALLA